MRPECQSRYGDDISTESIIVRLRRANPVPEVPVRDDDGLFARITVRPGDPRLTENQPRWLVLRRRRLIARRARAAEASALQGALDVLVGELRVGVHPVAAFDVAAREVDGPVATSLRAVAARARLGADVAAWLRNFA